LELNWEIDSGTRLNSDIILINLEIRAAIKFNPVANGILRRIAKFDILSYKVTKYSWELNLCLRDVMRETLIQLNYKEEKFTSRRISDILRCQMCGEAYLTHCINKFLCVEKHLIFVENTCFHVLNILRRLFSIV
jgi:hypothetical protein